MGSKPVKIRSGLMLIEIMIAIVVVVVGILGAMMYRYHSALDARRADIQVGAGRVALLILEGWKGAAGDLAYDPSSDIGLQVLNSDDITISGTGPYTVQLTGGTDTTYEATLTFDEDVTGNGEDDDGIRKLTVEVTSSVWPVTISGFVRTF